MLKTVLPDVCAAACVLLQQLAAAKSDADKLRSEREQLAEVVLEMQVRG